MARLNPQIARIRRLLLIFALFFNISQGRRTSRVLTENSNVALYWGQGADQEDLITFCQEPSVDIIILSFMNRFPAQGNGWPGTDFGNHCRRPGFYHAPGNDSSKDQLLSDCPHISADIPVCQGVYGKKILLSLGGEEGGYELTGTADGEAFADFLWGAFGPQTREWLDGGLPRPFDGPNDFPVEVDGFDFDIEHPSSDNQIGYIAMIQRLRAHFIGAEKQYLITGAPQCMIPDANMGNMIAATQFDILFIQFYNTPQCSVRSWTISNPNYLTTGIEQFTLFSYNTWANFLVGTASANAKLYIGVSAAPAPKSDYLTRGEMAGIVKAYICRENFGGIMMWEATSAAKNIDPSGKTYYQSAKEILLHYENEPGLCCNTSFVPDKTLKPTCIPTGKTDTNTRPTPLPIQFGMSTQCASFYLVKNGDNCYNIAEAAGISLRDFLAWNPAVRGAECSDLWPGYHVCIGVF